MPGAPPTCRPQTPQQEDADAPSKTHKLHCQVHKVSVVFSHETASGCLCEATAVRAPSHSHDKDFETVCDSMARIGFMGSRAHSLTSQCFTMNDTMHPFNVGTYPFDTSKQSLHVPCHRSRAISTRVAAGFPLQIMLFKKAVYNLEDFFPGSLSWKHFAK